MFMRCGLVGLLVVGLVGLRALGQEDGAGEDPSRPLAPGVIVSIAPEEEPAETYSGPRPIVEIVKGIPNLEWTPNYDPETNTLQAKASSVVFRRTVWGLTFEFKPVRMIEADVPQPSGRMQRKQIWYLVYRVKNQGYALRPVQDGVTYDVEPVNFPTRRFFPHFVLSSHEFEKEYLDRIIPAAQAAIQQRENPGTRLYNSVEITRVPIPLSDERVERFVWGVAMWEDVDPRIDFFSIYVRGLTNAFRFEDLEDGYKPGDPLGSGRVYQFKTLQLNFWRPGDTIDPHEREIRYGIPIDSDQESQQAIIRRYGLDQRLDYLWVYR
jgi:hypothetical protein